MIRLLMLLVCLFLSVAWSQSDDYVGDKTISGTGFRYSCEDGGPAVWLQDVDNQYIDKIPTFRDGTPIPYEGDRDPSLGPRWLIRPDGFVSTLDSLFRSVLTEQEYQSLQGDLLMISMAVNTDTGRIMEIEYTIPRGANHDYTGAGFIRISPEKYYRIEKWLKEHIVYTVTDEGKRVTFMIALGFLAPGNSAPMYR